MRVEILIQMNKETTMKNKLFNALKKMKDTHFYNSYTRIVVYASEQSLLTLKQSNIKEDALPDLIAGLIKKMEEKEAITGKPFRDEKQINYGIYTISISKKDDPNPNWIFGMMASGSTPASKEEF